VTAPARSAGGGTTPAARCASACWRRSRLSGHTAACTGLAGETSVDSGPDGVDSGSEGLDSGPDGVDSGSEGVDSGPDGMDSGPEGVDSGPEGVDSVPKGEDSGPEGAFVSLVLLSYRFGGFRLPPCAAPARCAPLTGGGGGRWRHCLRLLCAPSDGGSHWRRPPLGPRGPSAPSAARAPGAPFREHSRNIQEIQGTFREHSGNIQGTFREHSADAREPPSQLQEAFKKSTKVDAEYNLPT
jgi:hypothetical protein